MADSTGVHVVIDRGGAARRTVWRCSLCRTRFYDPADLVARRVEWRALGANGRCMKSRVVAHECLKCLETDSEYLLPPMRKFVSADWERAPKADIESSDADWERAHPEGNVPKRY